MTKDNVFETLSKIKLKIDKKGRFNYASWTEAWKAVKKIYPNTTFKVYSTDSGFPAFIHKSAGGFVKVGVTINDIEYIECYPITDHYNKSINAELIDSFAINTSIQRAKVKALAHHGLGLWIYEGEDFPPKD